MIIFAVIIGPIAAVVITLLYQRYKEKQDTKLLDEIKQYQADIELYQKILDKLSLRLESVKVLLKEREEKIQKVRIIEYPKEVKVDLVQHFDNKISLNSLHYNIFRLMALSERYLKKYLQTAPDDNKARLELKRIMDEKSTISKYLSVDEKYLREDLSPLFKSQSFVDIFCNNFKQLYRNNRL